MSGLQIDGAPFIDPIVDQKTRLMLCGDPLTGAGWTADDLWPPGDRYFFMSSGPFSLAPGDTQVVTYALTAAQGADRMESFRLLKLYSKKVKWFYKHSTFPPIMENSDFYVSSQYPHIVLYFDDSAESFDHPLYSFEGYNLYGGESENGPWHYLHTFDRINSFTSVFEEKFDETDETVHLTETAKGQNIGLQYYHIINTDYRGDVLLPDKTYHFALAGYAIAEDEKAVPRVIESRKKVAKCLYTIPVLGAEGRAGCGDSIPVTQPGSGGCEDIKVKIIVPESLKGHKYQLSLESAAETGLWNLQDLESHEWLVRGKRLSGSVVYRSPVFDGFSVEICPPFDIDCTYEFETPANEPETGITKAQLDRISIFPNPYFGHNVVAEWDQQYVTISPLPRSCVIRIFSLSGSLIRTLNHKNTSFHQWDLKNRHGKAVASGLYLLVIDIPDLGQHLLKLAVVQRE